MYKDLLNIKDKLINTTILVLSLSLTIAGISSLFRVIHIGWHPIMYTNITISITSLTFCFFRKKISFGIKSEVLVTFFLVMGISTLLTWGMIGFGITLLSISAIYASIFLGFNRGLIIGAISTVIIALTGVGVTKNYIKFYFDIESYATSISLWSTITISFITAVITTVTTLGQFNRVLIKNLEYLQKQRVELKKSNESLRIEIELHKKSKEEIKVLQGFLPVCANCKKIRDEKNHWNTMESYITDNSEAKFTHTLCPECMKKLYPNIDLKD